MYEVEVNDHVNKVIKSIQRSFENQTGTNCILRCEGKEIKCHKYMLTAFSSYFKTLNDNESMFITNIKYKHLKIILRAIYYGIVNVPVNDLPILIKKAEKLGLENLFTGLPKDILTNDINIDSDDEDDEIVQDEQRDDHNDENDSNEPDYCNGYGNDISDDNSVNENDIRKNNGHNYDKKRERFTKVKLNGNNVRHHMITSKWTNGKHCNYVVKQNKIHKINFTKCSNELPSSTISNSIISSNKTNLIVDNKPHFVTILTNNVIDDGLKNDELNINESSDSEHEVDIKNANLNTIRYLKGGISIQNSLPVATDVTVNDSKINDEVKDESSNNIKNTSGLNPSKILNNAILSQNDTPNSSLIKSNNIQQQQQAFKKQLFNTFNGRNNDENKNNQVSSANSSRPSSPSQSSEEIISKKPSITTTFAISTNGTGNQSTTHPVAITYHPLIRNSETEYIEYDEEIFEDDDEDEDDEINLAATSGGDEDNWDDFRIDGDDADWKEQIRERKREYHANSDYGNNDSDDGCSSDILKRKRKRTRDPKNFKNRFPCPECGKILANFYYKEEHVRVKHSKVNLSCLEPGCHFEVLERDKYNEHLKRVHGKEIKRGRPRSDASF